MNPHRRALIELHVCVVLWGFTAILGKLITLPAHAAGVVAHVVSHAWRWPASRACGARSRRFRRG